MPTQDERRAQTRALLLDAAADQFARKGFHATSAEAVAAAADRTTGALRDHFGSKEGLLVALLEQWLAEVIVDITEAHQAESDLAGYLGTVWDGLVHRDGDTDDPWLLLEFELWLHAARDPEMGMVGAERYRAMRAGMAQGLTEWSERFDFELPAPADELAALLLALLMGAAFQHRLDPAEIRKDMVVSGLLRLLELPAPAHAGVGADRSRTTAARPPNTP